MINLIVDANEVFSAVIAKGRRLQTKKLEILFSDKVKLYSPYKLFEEISKVKNKEDMKYKSSFSDKELDLFLKALESRIEIIPGKELLNTLSEAKSISTHSKDNLFFATALKLNCPIWSGEKRLKNQSKVEVFNTKDLVEKYGL